MICVLCAKKCLSLTSDSKKIHFSWKVPKRYLCCYSIISNGLKVTQPAEYSTGTDDIILYQPIGSILSYIKNTIWTTVLIKSIIVSFVAVYMAHHTACVMPLNTCDIHTISMSI